MILIISFPYSLLSMVSLSVILMLQTAVAMILVVEATDKVSSLHFQLQNIYIHTYTCRCHSFSSYWGCIFTIWLRSFACELWSKTYLTSSLLLPLCCTDAYLTTGIWSWKNWEFNFMSWFPVDLIVIFTMVFLPLLTENLNEGTEVRSELNRECPPHALPTAIVMCF